MTDAQIELLRDKIRLWREAATYGRLEFRDYNRRAAEALEECLHQAGADNY